MVPRQLGAGADQDRLGAPADFDGVVGDQAMAADDQIERALALADAALAGDQDAEPEDVHQHGVDDRALGERVFEDRAELGDGGRRRHGGLEQRQPRALGFGDQLRRRREPAGDQDAGKARASAPAASRRSRAAAVEALEVADLALAEDQHAARLQVLVEAGERQAGLLDVRAGDEAVEAVAPGQELERQAERLGPAAQERADGDARDEAASRHSNGSRDALGTASTRFRRASARRSAGDTAR